MFRTIRYSAILFILLSFATVCAQRDRDTYNVSPQSFEVSGQVRVSGTNDAAQNVQVRLERFNGGIVDQMATDARGRFRFTNLQRGYYKIVINSPGFRPAQQDADLQVLFKAFLVFDLVAESSTRNLPVGSLDVIDARVPPEARDEFSRGRAELSKNNPEQAVLHLQKAIMSYPEFFEARLLLATAFMDQRKWTEAEEALNRALDVRSQDPTVLVALGEVYWREKRFEEAEKTLQEGLKADDKSWHGYFTLARLYWEQNQVMKAAPAVGRTLQLKPDFGEAHLLAGNILLKLGQQERALIEYQEYLRLEPKGSFAPQTKDLIEKLNKAIGSKQ
jgi:tetratricopeptide (TPR) repeat protein